MNRSKKKKFVSAIITLLIVVGGCYVVPNSNDDTASMNNAITYEYEGEMTTVIGEPTFTEEEMEKAKLSYMSFTDLDSLGRCGKAEASIGRDIMPTGERQSIGMIKPSGWHTARYDDLISDKYLYNRCHLIAWCLCGENANEKNLITGTRALNMEMLDYELKVAKYVEKTNNHVIYRVTPQFEDDNLVASGVTMMAKSVEDNGEGISFNVYIHNIQPGIEIDYKTGDNWRA